MLHTHTMRPVTLTFGPLDGETWYTTETTRRLSLWLRSSEQCGEIRVAYIQFSDTNEYLFAGYEVEFKEFTQ